MKNNIISKEKFIKIMNKIRVLFDFHDEVNSLYYKYDYDGVLCDGGLGLADEIIDILDTMFDCYVNPDIGSDICYFIYEIDFGREYYPGCVTDNGENIDLSDAGKLYDYIIKKMNENHEEKASLIVEE